MENKALISLNVEEINETQKSEVNGGLLNSLFWLGVGIIVSECLDRGASDDFMDGWNAGGR